jgi:hypothetical protein
MNKSKLLFLKLVFLFIFFNQSVQAQSNRGVSSKSAKPMSYSSGSSGLLFDFGVYYGQSEAVAKPSVGNEWKDVNSIYDVKLGYILVEGLYFGAEYSVRTQSATSTNLNSSTGNAAAFGGGYFWGNGFNLRAYYRLNELSGDYKSGSGFQADLGYMINMSSSFYLGFLVSHRQVTFAENKTIANFDYWTRKETFPFLTLGFLIK